MSTDSIRMQPVHTIQGASGEQFFRVYFGRQPVVIANAISAWPARHWTPEYLKSRYGDLQVAVARYDPGARETFLDQTLGDVHQYISLRQFLSALGRENSIYAMREDTTLFERAPSLIEELAFFSPFMAAGKTVAYKALWIGPANYITGLHLDPGDTLLFQLYGRKNVMLFHPRQTRYLYEEPPDQAARKFVMSALQKRLDPSAFDVLRDKVRWCAVQPFNPDLVRFPLFVRAECIQAEIGPGDVLYIPDGWWHAVKAIDAAISVSIEPDFRDSPFSLEPH